MKTYYIHSILIALMHCLTLKIIKNKVEKGMDNKNFSPSNFANSISNK